MKNASLKFAAAVIAPMALAACTTTSPRGPQTAMTAATDVEYGRPGYDEQGDPVYPTYPATQRPAQTYQTQTYQTAAPTRTYDPAFDRRSPQYQAGHRSPAAVARPGSAMAAAAGVCRPTRPQLINQPTMEWGYRDTNGTYTRSGRYIPGVSEEGCFWHATARLIDSDCREKEVDVVTGVEYLVTAAGNATKPMCMTSGAITAPINSAKDGLRRMLQSATPSPRW